MPELVTDSLSIIEKDTNGDILVTWYVRKKLIIFSKVDHHHIPIIAHYHKYNCYFYL